MVNERDKLPGVTGQSQPGRGPGLVIALVLALVAIAAGAAFLIGRNPADSDNAQTAAANGAMPAAPAPPRPEKALPPAAPAPTDLSSAVNISNGECSFGPVLDHALDGMIVYRGSPPAGQAGRVTLAGQSYVPSLTSTRNSDIGDPNFRNLDATVRLASPAAWHGLRLTGLRSSTGWEWAASSLEFADSPARVQAALRSIGISIPLPPGSRDIPQECSGSIAIEARPNGAALTCSSGC